MSKKIHFIQHVHFETPGFILDWAKEKKYTTSFTYLFENEKLPRFNAFDFLVIMGGPMSVYEEDKYLFLSEEKKFIKEAIEKNKVVLGICLGAQLIAEALGSKVYSGPNKEIGWFPVEFINKSIFNTAASTVFHWHGDTFDIPDEAIHLAGSEGTPNQAFIYNNKVLALQFHIEVKQENIRNMLEYCKDDITEGQYIQDEMSIANQTGFFEVNRRLLWQILNFLSDNLNKTIQPLVKKLS
ncbi:MAG: amidotransferase [Bacteroidales bacterium]|nr:amidotransferase [Bacteroidales bacterium]MBN2821130.1 amidotransferase [Bacteroidales bacterium]